MHHSNLHNQKVALRFRKWSRKSWVVFHSLGKEVTIGRLIVPASNQALKKNTTHATAFDALQNVSKEKEEITSPDFALVSFVTLLLCLELLIVSIQQKVALPSLPHFNYHTTLSCEMLTRSFTGFFMLKKYEYKQ